MAYISSLLAFARRTTKPDIDRLFSVFCTSKSINETRILFMSKNKNTKSRGEDEHSKETKKNRSERRNAINSLFLFELLTRAVINYLQRRFVFRLFFLPLIFPNVKDDEISLVSFVFSLVFYRYFFLCT